MKTIKNFTIAIIVLCSLFVIALPQSKVKRKTQKIIKLDKNHPSIYLSLEKVGKVEDEPEVFQNRVWLRLHNNSRWTITLDASGGSKYDDASLYYVTTDNDGNVKDYYTCTACSIINLGSRRTILFTVPLEIFDDVGSLRMEYSYEWEKNFGNNTSNLIEEEPTHYVFFYTEYLRKTKDQ